MSYIKSHERN